MTKQIRAVLFDCDGVLIDSATDISDAVNKTLKAQKLKTLSYEKLKSFVGNGAQTLVERALRESLGLNPATTTRKETASRNEVALPYSTAEIKEITALYLKNYYAAATVKTKLYPGLEDALKTLKDSGLRLGIVTNKPSKILMEILKYFGIAKYFDAPIGADKVKNLKPSPDGIFLALDQINAKIEKEIARKEGGASKPKSSTNSPAASTSKINSMPKGIKSPLRKEAAAGFDFIPIAPEETIMVGDSYTDIAAGRAAGTLTAACLKGMGENKRTLAEKPDLQLGYAAEIANAVLLANKIISR